MINSLETVIQFLRGQNIASGQVADRVVYGSLWPHKTPAVVVRLDGGESENEIPVQPIRLEVRAYGVDSYSALNLLGLVDELKWVDRVVVGQGLLYYFIQDSGPSLLHDDVVDMDFALRFYRALVSEGAINA